MSNLIYYLIHHHIAKQTTNFVNMRFSAIFILLAISLSSKGEKLPPIIKKLSQAPGSINTYSHIKEPFFPISDLSTNFLNVYQHILKTPTRTLLLLPGTGRVYELAIVSDSLQLIRKDKTYFTGYNFQSLPFVLDTMLYSFGGYGFWRFNGELRVFMPTIGEWDAIHTNRYIPKAIELESANNFHYIDATENTLYVSGPQFTEESIIQPENSPLYRKLFKLNIKKAAWEEIGEIQVSSLKFIAYSPFGLLCINNEEYQIVDIKQNKIFSISGKTKEKLIHTPTSTSYQDIRLSYCIGNMLYVGDMDNWMDSVYIDSKDLIDTGLKIYSPKTNKTFFLLPVLFIVVITISILFFRKKKINPISTQESITAPDTAIHLQSSITNEFLEEREKQLLYYILTQSQEGKLTSILQINELLGLNKRTLEVQKRIRTDMIGAINSKCKLLTQKEEPILSRNRSELDKRMFEYFVTPERFAEAEAILASQRTTKTE